MGEMTEEVRRKEIENESCFTVGVVRVTNFKSRKNPYQVLQVMRESVSGTKSRVLRLNVQCNRRFI